MQSNAGRTCNHGVGGSCKHLAMLKSLWRSREKLIITSVAGLLIVIGWLLGRLGLNSVLSNSLMIVAAVVAGYRIAMSAFHALRFRILGINALVTLAAAGAIIVGEYWEAAVVTFLFSLGSYLEARTLDKTRDALRKLMEMAPQVAHVRKGEEEVDVPAEEVRRGDLVIVRPGEKIPVDGKVVKGRATVNQAAITGESMPAEKAVGDSVFSGTINEAGYLEIETEKSGEDTTFARLIELVEEAQQEKARSQQALENFARYYTPGIIVVSVLTYLVTKNPITALTLLVIACPGALVIATPVSIVAGIGNAARQGVLIKGGEHLEKVGQIQVVVLDKTGTLTRGRPQVTGLWVKRGTETEMLLKTAAVEKLSEHPLAKSVVERAAGKGRIPEAADFQVLPGYGVMAMVAGKKVCVGNRKLMQEQGIVIDSEVEERMASEENTGCTAIIVAENREILGVIFIADVPREDALNLVSRLKRTGVEKVVMLTGDNERTASAIAHRLGIDEFRAEMLPEEKVAVIKSLREKGRIVAMVGDGINDAPAMATADVGIAMGAAGTDVAMETADLVLMSDRLVKLPYAIGLSRRTLRNIKQNVTLAVLVVLVLLVGVIGEAVVLASGMLVHEASVLLVILNAMRLLKYREI
ncbi:heavy metal translocating P-type ATPase [Desulfolucanica intricata]|uniref:heavy metal translocating P-type ATPase n=1 Tax=Desulfolucanica intricata TaxID=1285191 RepID=UPI0009ED02FD|nr:cation-translocating P-type ATPase [Desulfolucanica intricata]